MLVNRVSKLLLELLCGVLPGDLWDDLISIWCGRHCIRWRNDVRYIAEPHISVSVSLMSVSWTHTWREIGKHHAATEGFIQWGLEPSPPLLPTHTLLDCHHGEKFSLYPLLLQFICIVSCFSTMHYLEKILAASSWWPPRYWGLLCRSL